MLILESGVGNGKAFIASRSTRHSPQLDMQHKHSEKSRLAEA